MNLPLAFHPADQRELDDAAHYYALEHPALAIALVDERQRSAVAIKSESVVVSSSQASRPVLSDTEVPYGIFYEVKTNEIRILAIAHLKRRPLYWADRT